LRPINAPSRLGLYFVKFRPTLRSGLDVSRRVMMACRILLLEIFAYCSMSKRGAKLIPIREQ
jgi:hypothetical protein